MGKKISHDIKHSCGLLNDVFSVCVGEVSAVTTLLRQGDVEGGLSGVRERITDGEIAEGNYCYFTIKLYILGGITPDRADHSCSPDVCVRERVSVKLYPSSKATEATLAGREM